MNWTELTRTIKESLYGKGVPGEGSRRATVMIVGEAPGVVEARYGRPFIGPQGKRLRTLIKDAGLSASEVYLTNAVKIRPPGNRRPTAEEINAWRDTLMQEVRLLNPRIIVALGTTAVRSLRGRQTMVLPHMGYARYQKGVYDRIKAGLARVAKRVRREAIR